MLSAAPFILWSWRWSERHLWGWGSGSSRGARAPAPCRRNAGSWSSCEAGTCRWGTGNTCSSCSQSAGGWRTLGSAFPRRSRLSPCLASGTPHPAWPGFRLCSGRKEIKGFPSFLAVLIIIPNYAIKHNRLSHKKIPSRHNKEQRIKTSNKTPPTEISPLPAGSQVLWGVGREEVSAWVSPPPQPTMPPRWQNRT